MTFKITPEDVGRVAVDAKGDTYECKCVASVNAAFLRPNKLYVFRLDGTDPRMVADLIHWKPETVRMPWRWFNIYRGRRGAPIAYEFDCFYQASVGGEDALARHYGRHWDGAEIGTFHTEEDAMRIREAEGDD